MTAVLIYKSPSQHYYSFVISDDNLYYDAIKVMPKDGNKILWSKGRVSLEQLENSRKTKDNLVKRLNEGEKIKLKDLKNELKGFFSKETKLKL